MLEKIQKQIEDTAYEIFLLKEPKIRVPSDIKEDLARIKYIRDHHSGEWNKLYTKMGSLIAKFYLLDNGKKKKVSGHTVELIQTLLKCLNSFNSDFYSENYNWENKTFLKYFNSAFFKEAERSDSEEKRKESEGDMKISVEAEKIQSRYEVFKENLYKAGKIKTFDSDCVKQFCATHIYKNTPEENEQYIRSILGNCYSVSDENTSEESGDTSESLYGNQKNNPEILKQIFEIFGVVNKEKKNGFSDWEKAVLTHWVISTNDLSPFEKNKTVIVGNLVTELQKSCFYSQEIFDSMLPPDSCIQTEAKDTSQLIKTGRDLERKMGFEKSYYSKTLDRIFTKVVEVIKRDEKYHPLFSILH